MPIDNSRVLMAAAFVLFCALAALQSARGAQEPPEQGILNHGMGYTEAQLHAWADEPFSGDDTPCAAIRADVDAEIKRGGDLDALLLQCRKMKDAKPFDEERIFRWAYFLYRLSELPTRSVSQGKQALYEAEGSFEKAPPPATYNYTRLRFLINANTWPLKYLEPLGERLAEKDPNDFSAKYLLAAIDIEEYSPMRKQEAFALIADLKRIDPNDPSPLTLLGEAYMLMWAVSHNAAQANQAIVYYQEFLNKAPADNGFREDAAYTIGLIKNGLARHY